MIDTVYYFLDKAAEQLDIPKAKLEELKQANQEHSFKIELKSGKSFDAFRVQHSNKRGPCKGGIRFHKSVNLPEVQTLAALMSLKTAAAGLPLGGGKGGVAVDPRELNSDELEELSRAYVKGLHPHIGPDKDVPAPDVNTTAQIIDWMVDEYEKITGDQTRASFTGKSIGNGGSLGRDEATGRGGVYCLEELLKLEGKPNESITFAVQGFGNVGSYFATIAHERHPNWKLIATSDSEATIYSESGLDAKNLLKFKADKGRFKDYKKDEVRAQASEELVKSKVDVLVLAGLENAVNSDNQDEIQAKYIVEMANDPIDYRAHEHLIKKGLTILPDIIANAGGVIVSYLEWQQNLNGEHWPHEKVNSELEKIIKKSMDEVYDSAQKNGTDLKEAAYTIALKRLI